jgi:hypothetical protein
MTDGGQVNPASSRRSSQLQFCTYSHMEHTVWGLTYGLFTLFRLEKEGCCHEIHRLKGKITNLAINIGKVFFFYAMLTYK